MWSTVLFEDCFMTSCWSKCYFFFSLTTQYKQRREEHYAKLSFIFCKIEQIFFIDKAGTWQGLNNREINDKCVWSQRLQLNPTRREVWCPPVVSQRSHVHVHRGGVRTSRALRRYDEMWLGGAQEVHISKRGSASCCDMNYWWSRAEAAASQRAGTQPHSHRWRKH